MCRSRRSSRIASIRIWSPSGSKAKASAVARFATPGGPWKRYACAGPWTSAAASRPLASACSGMLSKLIQDLARDLDGTAAAVDARDPLREGVRQLPVGVVDPRAEVRVLALDPVALAAHPAARLSRVDQEQVGAVGEHAADRVQVELEHALETEPARDPLVRERRVEVTVADHVRPSRQRRGDHLIDEL